MRKLICFCLLLPLFVLPSAALTLSARSAVLYDPLTGELIWQRDPTRPMSMASTTKIMTALIALERYEPEREIVIEPQWAGIEGSSMYLRASETVTVRELLYGLLLMSGNDAAEALAGAWSGDRADFIALMNRRAGELGLSDTLFENPSGLDEGDHRATALDLARLTAAALRQPLFREIVSTQSVFIAGRDMRNHNKLLSLCPGAIGVKTGYTKKAGRCLVSACMRRGRELIAVTLDAPDDWNDHIVLYDDAYDSMSEQRVIPQGTVGELPVVGGEGDVCRLRTEQGLDALLFPHDRDHLSLTLKVPRMLYAPVTAGERCGVLTASIGDLVLGEATVYCQNDVAAAREPRSPLGRLFDCLFRK